MTEPLITEADRKAALEIQAAQQEYDPASFPLTQSETASIIARHHAAERERARRIEKALAQLVAKLEVIIPKVDNMCAFMHGRGMSYDGPTLNTELAEARAALEKK